DAARHADDEHIQANSDAAPKMNLENGLTQPHRLRTNFPLLPSRQLLIHQALCGRLNSTSGFRQFCWISSVVEHHTTRETSLNYRKEVICAQADSVYVRCYFLSFHVPSHPITGLTA